MRFQRTIKSSVSCQGIGLHTGKTTFLTLKPAPAGTGIVFIRMDLNNMHIRARGSNIATTGYATILSENGASVKTVEHLLAAFAGLHIDNAIVEIDSEEVPIMDGSARSFVRLIADAGVQTQEKIQPVLKILKPLVVRDEDKQLAIWPADMISISCCIHFHHPLLKEQSRRHEPNEESFLREISDARTFGFLQDFKTLQANGLAKGASLDNTVVLDDYTIVNKEGLRSRDECVRHKILDLIGDLSLIGMPIIGHVVAYKSGHCLNARMVNTVLNHPQNWITLGLSKIDDFLYREKPLPQPAVVA